MRKKTPEPTKAMGSDFFEFNVKSKAPSTFGKVRSGGFRG